MKPAEEIAGLNDGFTMLRNDHRTIELVEAIQRDALRVWAWATYILVLVLTVLNVWTACRFIEARKSALYWQENAVTNFHQPMKGNSVSRKNKQ
jgi:hypothetical protein